MKKLFIMSALLVSSMAAVQATPATKTVKLQPAATTVTKSALPVAKGAKSLSGVQKSQVNGGVIKVRF